MISRLPVWLLAVAVALGLLLAVWLRGPGTMSSPPKSSLGPGALSSPPTVAATTVPASAVLLAVGDTASCDNTDDSAVAALAASLPGAIALLGDLVYPDGSASDFANCFDPVWGPLRDRLRPAPGNHEYRTAGASGYFDYFGSQAGTPGQGWYAYTLGSWRVLVLNSNCEEVGGCGPGSAQLAWLRGQLARAPACTLAYWHHPRYSSGMHGDSDFMSDVWSLLADSNADLVLGGHDHDYERLVADGMREFVVGTGGRSLYTLGGRSDFTEARNDRSYGLLKLTLGSGTYAWQFIPVEGSSFTDAGTGECH